MQMFIFLVVTALLVYIIFSFLLPPITEEEEEEVWDAAELRLESLLQGVIDPRTDIREKYRNRILAMGASVIPRLADVLSQELFLAHHEVRIMRLKELLRDFGLRSVPALLQMLEEEGSDPEVANAVQELLLEIGPASLPLVLEQLSPALVLPVLPVLQEWGESSIRATMKAFHKAPSKTMWRRILLAFGDISIPYLETAVDSWDEETAACAFQVLAELAPSSSAELFISELSSKRPNIRAFSALALGKIATMKAFDPVEKLLSDSNAQVRVKAIEAYGKIGQGKAIEGLVQFLEESRIVPERLEESLSAAVVLARLGEPVSTSLVDLALASSTSLLRQMGLRLLEELPVQDNFLYLERLLWDRDEYMVQEAIRVLSDQGSAKSTLTLLSFAGEYDLGHQRSLWIENALLPPNSIVTSALVASLKKKRVTENGIALRVLLQGDEVEAVEPILLCLQNSEDPGTIWGIEPEDLHLFLQQVAERTELKDVLVQFLAEHKTSPLTPALEMFLSQLSRPLSPLPIEPRNSKVHER